MRWRRRHIGKLATMSITRGNTLSSRCREAEEPEGIEERNKQIIMARISTTRRITLKITITSRKAVIHTSPKEDVAMITEETSLITTSTTPVRTPKITRVTRPIRMNKVPLIFHALILFIIVSENRSYPSHKAADNYRGNYGGSNYRDAKKGEY